MKIFKILLMCIIADNYCYYNKQRVMHIIILWFYLKSVLLMNYFIMFLRD